MPVKEKIIRVAHTMYNAKDVCFSRVAEEQIAQYTRKGFGNLTVCIAKTQLSLSHDPQLKGCPADYILPVEEVRLSAGAGYLYPLCAKISTMPGLPSSPIGADIDIDAQGNPRGIV